MIRSNFRGTREISGDFRAQTAANRLGRAAAPRARSSATAGKTSRVSSTSCSATRSAAPPPSSRSFPDGEFSAELLMDGDGVQDVPVRLEATVRIDRGRVTVDLTGCDEQRPSPTNATFSQTCSAVAYVLKCLIDPDIPVNDGFYRLVDIRTRPGSVVDARHPAAVAAGWEIAMQICDLMFKALAPALPDRVIAGTKGCVCNIAFGGVNPAYRRVLHLLRDHRRRLRRVAAARRDGRGPGPLPEYGERAGRGDRGQLSRPHPPLRAHRGFGGAGSASRRPRRAARLRVPRPRAELLHPLRQGAPCAVGTLRRRRCPARASTS